MLRVYCDRARRPPPERLTGAPATGAPVWRFSARVRLGGALGVVGSGVVGTGVGRGLGVPRGGTDGVGRYSYPSVLVSTPAALDTTTFTLPGLGADGTGYVLGWGPTLDRKLVSYGGRSGYPLTLSIDGSVEFPGAGRSHGAKYVIALQLVDNTWAGGPGEHQ